MNVAQLIELLTRFQDTDAVVEVEEWEDDEQGPASTIPVSGLRIELMSQRPGYKVVLLTGSRSA